MRLGTTSVIKLEVAENAVLRALQECSLVNSWRLKCTKGDDRFDSLTDMDIAQPSKTALGVAVRRASHQLYDFPPLIFEDPVAVPILGESYRSRLEEAADSINEGLSLALRAWVLVRNRYAEDKLAEAVSHGVRQYVLLGAGLDTFAFRNSHSDLTVFEVDHPATQQWKRELIGLSGLAVPSSLRYVPVNFENESLAQQLQENGLDLAKPTFFSWLGVVLYLTRSAFRATVGLIDTLPAGSGIIMDYALPDQALDPDELESRNILAERVRKIGEPFQLFFTPEEMAAELSNFRSVEDLDVKAINHRYFSGRTDRLRLYGKSGRMVSAWR